MKKLLSTVSLCIFLTSISFIQPLSTAYAIDFNILGSITVTYPLGGEVFEVGSKPIITYASVGENGNVNLDYSTDGGSTWMAIATDQLNDGDYKGWIVPNTPSTNCKIKVSDVDGDPIGISNGLFTINAPQAESYPPISPKWVFEPWVWEDSIQTKDAALACLNGYTNRNIPVGALLIDSPWEQPLGPLPYVNDETDSGYNTFKFDWKYYPNPGPFIKSLHDRGIKVILWITGNMTTNSPNYDYAKSEGYFIKDRLGNTLVTDFWRGIKRGSHINFFNSNAKAKAYWDTLMDKVLHNDSIKIDGWKVDQSDYYLIEHLDDIYDGSTKKTMREYQDAYYSHLYDYTVKVKGSEVGMITARPYCKELGKDGNGLWYAPISANPAGWVGDQKHNWEGLNLALNNIFKSAAAGYAALGSDIGGFGSETDYTQNKNLFIRWAQFGAMVPIMENGGKKNRQHQPWLFDSGSDTSTVRIYRYYAWLHHHLVPYFYSYDIVAHNTGTSITRPIGESNTWNGKWYYMLGDNIFIAAICTSSTSKEIKFPSENNWIDYWNEDNIYTGGTTRTLNYSLDKYPIFFKAGAIIPMNVDADITGHGSAASKNYLTLLIFPHGSSTFEYHSDPSTKTVIKCDSLCGGFIIDFSKPTGSVIIRLKNRIEPGSIILSGNVNLQKKNTFAEFEGASSGWFHGRLHAGDSIHTWIKFSNAVDTVKVINTSISSIIPTTYELSKLNVGNKYYVDRDFTLTGIPDEYKRLFMIKTANNNKSTVDLDFHFNTCSSADIFIAYDHRLNAPSWIKNYYDSTGKKIYVSDTYVEYFNIWKKSVSTGVVTLGDNQGTSASSMYFLFINSFLNPPLPVELSNLHAIIEKGNCVILKWETKTEVNNYGFEIERKTSDTWVKIGFVQGSGNSNSPKSYTYADNNLIGGSKFAYRLKQIDVDGKFEYSSSVEVEIIPEMFELSQNYPNPFNPITKITFAIPKEIELRIVLYNVLGESIKTIAEGKYDAGYHEVELLANDLPSGVYVYRLESKDFLSTKKLLLMK